MKALICKNGQRRGPEVFDNDRRGYIVQWMHPARFKAIRAMAAVAMLAILAGCETTAEGEAVPLRTANPAPTPQAQPAVATAAPEPARTAPASQPATTNAAPTATEGQGSTNETLVVTQEVPPVRPANLKITAAVENVLKLAQSNVDEKVLVAYVERSAEKFDLDADEILYLADVGVPSAVITAMLKRDGVEPSKAEVLTGAPNTELNQPALPEANTNPQVAAAPPQTIEVTTNYVPHTTVVAQAPAQTVLVQPQTVVIQQPETVQYFYSSLSPYGSWYYVADYGWCWQPTVAVIDRGWRPYGHRGRWVWSTAGWYWHSDYSWGWAPFHYGRWHMAGGRGWIWVPDRTWGPAWVTWRNSGDYCGWAPLPPAARYTGVGFSFHGRNVDVNFGFGLGYDAYCFAPMGRLRHPRVIEHCAPRRENHHIWARSRVENRYEHGRDHHFVNRGVAEAVPRDVRPAAIRELPERDRERFGNRDRVERNGAETVVYRPRSPRTEGTGGATPATPGAPSPRENSAGAGRTPAAPDSGVVRTSPRRDGREGRESSFTGRAPTAPVSRGDSISPSTPSAPAPSPGASTAEPARRRGFEDRGGNSIVRAPLTPPTRESRITPQPVAPTPRVEPSNLPGRPGSIARPSPQVGAPSTVETPIQRPTGSPRADRTGNGLVARPTTPTIAPPANLPGRPAPGSFGGMAPSLGQPGVGSPSPGIRRPTENPVGSRSFTPTPAPVVTMPETRRGKEFSRPVELGNPAPMARREFSRPSPTIAAPPAQVAPPTRMPTAQAPAPQISRPAPIPSQPAPAARGEIRQPQRSISPEPAGRGREAGPREAAGGPTRERRGRE